MLVEREKIMAKMRKNGLTYKQISEIFDITTVRARQVILKEERKSSFKKEQAEKRTDAPSYIGEPGWIYRAPWDEKEKFLNYANSHMGHKLKSGEPADRQFNTLYCEDCGEKLLVKTKPVG